MKAIYLAARAVVPRFKAAESRGRSSTWPRPPASARGPTSPGTMRRRAGSSPPTRSMAVELAPSRHPRQCPQSRRRRNAAAEDLHGRGHAGDPGQVPRRPSRSGASRRRTTSAMPPAFLCSRRSQHDHRRGDGGRRRPLHLKARSAPTPKIELKVLSPHDWPVVEALFGPRGVTGGCWCMWWRRRGGKTWDACKGEPNRLAFRELVRQGEAQGVIASAEGEPVGWCNFGPREDFLRLGTSRVLQRPEQRQTLVDHLLLCPHRLAAQGRRPAAAGACHDRGLPPRRRGGRGLSQDLRFRRQFARSFRLDGIAAHVRGGGIQARESRGIDPLDLCEDG